MSCAQRGIDSATVAVDLEAVEMLGWAVLVNALTMACYRAAKVSKAAAWLTPLQAPPSKDQGRLGASRRPSWRNRSLDPPPLATLQTRWW